MNDPRVLVAAPTSSYKDYCLIRFFCQILNLTYPTFDFYLVDNTADNGYYQKKLKSYGINCDHIEPKGRTLAVVMAECWEMIRQKAVNEKYDYLFSLETDIFIPRNLIELLLTHKKLIVSVPYFFGFGKDSCLLIDAIVTEKREKEQDQILRTFHLSFEDSFMLYDGKLTPSYANGQGCTLISREILEKITFHSEFNREDMGSGFADSFLYYDIFWNLKLVNYIDTSVIIRHENSDWEERFIVFKHK